MANFVLKVNEGEKKKPEMLPGFLVLKVKD
jgi:hypothetical protein